MLILEDVVQDKSLVEYKWLHFYASSTCRVKNEGLTSVLVIRTVIFSCSIPLLPSRRTNHCRN